MEEYKIEMDESSQLVTILQEQLAEVDAEQIESIDYVTDEYEDGTKQIRVVIDIN